MYVKMKNCLGYSVHGSDKGKVFTTGTSSSLSSVELVSVFHSFTVLILSLGLTGLGLGDKHYISLLQTTYNTRII